MINLSSSNLPIEDTTLRAQKNLSLTCHWNKVAWYYNLHFRQLRNFKLRQMMLFFSWLIQFSLNHMWNPLRIYKKIMDHICTLWHEHLFVQRSVIFRHVYKTWSISISLLPSFVCDCTDTIIKTWKSIEIVKIWEGMSLTFGVAQSAGMLNSVLLV